ncbi:MAG: acetyltransferase [Bryobacterales bacterium]|nr:acetyltransferase [Bryobacterales bacterium]
MKGLGTCGAPRGARVMGRLLAAGWLSFQAFGQVLVSPPGAQNTIRLHNTDLAVLEAGEARKDLPCVVVPEKPFLGFDLKFHSGYDISIPLSDLAGADDLLTIIFRVAPEGRREAPIYFTQKVRVPAIEEDAKGDALLQGGFDVGPGKYFVDLLVRDRAERICALSWDIEAKLPSKDAQMELTMAEGLVQSMESAQFREEPIPPRVPGQDPLKLKILVNFAPQKALASALRPVDTAALVSLLRTLSRDPRVGRFSLVAFNLQEQRVLFRQEAADRIDFPALGDSLQSLNLGTVDLKRLSNKNGGAEFLSTLMEKEFANTEQADAVVFAGPKAMLEANIPSDHLKRLSEFEVPVFYMNYILNPYSNPWRDSIGQAVKFLKGVEFTITRPRDLWFAVTDMVARLVKTRNAKQVASVKME